MGRKELIRNFGEQVTTAHGKAESERLDMPFTWSDMQLRFPQGWGSTGKSAPVSWNSRTGSGGPPSWRLGVGFFSVKRRGGLEGGDS